MAALVLVSVVCVLMGGLIGALPSVGPRVLGAIRTFALCAVLGVVALHFIPESLQRLGWMGGLLFGLGLGLPALAERLGPRASAGKRGAELGFLGLLLHQVSDGLALWATGHGAVPGADVGLALFAHSTPLAALLFLRFEALSGRFAATLRVGTLAVVSALGVGLGGFVTALAPDAWLPATGAFAAGLLLHLFAHDLRLDAPRSPTQRWFDLVAAGLGITLSVIGLNAHARVDPDAAELARALRTVLLGLGVDTAPMLLVGMGLGALLQTLRPRIPAAFIHGGSSLSQALRGAVIGTPLPVCACGVLPIAESLTQRGAGAALVVSFVLMTPELGFDTFLLTGRMLGWPFAWLRLLGAALLSVVAAWVVAHVAGHGGRAGNTELTAELGRGSFVRRLLHTFDDLFHHTGPWIAVGLLAAAYVQVVVPEGALVQSRPGLDVLVVSALAIPSYVCAAAATPLGAVLLSKGLSVGAVFAGLVLGPVVNLATLSFFARAFGRTATLCGVAALVVSSLCLAWAVNAWLPGSAVTFDLNFESQAQRLLSSLAAAVLLLLLSRSMWRSGTRAWLASLASTDHVHSHVRAVDAGQA